MQLDKVLMSLETNCLSPNPSILSILVAKHVTGRKHWKPYSLQLSELKALDTF
jgi:hypothetical protein